MEEKQDAKRQCYVVRVMLQMVDGTLGLRTIEGTRKRIVGVVVEVQKKEQDFGIPFVRVIEMDGTEGLLVPGPGQRVVEVAGNLSLVEVVTGHTTVGLRQAAKSNTGTEPIEAAVAAGIHWKGVFAFAEWYLLPPDTPALETRVNYTETDAELSQALRQRVVPVVAEEPAGCNR
jgi:hypothetical protein